MLLTGFAYTTLLERRVIARFQSRVGPNRAGPQGLLQPLADGIKLIFKEEVMPASADKWTFILAPMLAVIPAFVVFAVIPIGGSSFELFGADDPVDARAESERGHPVRAGDHVDQRVRHRAGGLGQQQQVFDAGQPALVGADDLVRTGDGPVAGGAGGGDRARWIMNAIVDQQKQVWFFFLQPVGAIIFMITALAEVNRAPFDMPEAEQELTSGYNTEYSGMKFALFYMAEYIKMIVISALAVTFFFGGYREPLPLFVTQAMPLLERG